MKERAVKILSSILIAVFVNFAFANTVFLHTHQGFAGHAVTHSHPFFPSSHHGHTSQSLDQVAAFNTASVSVDVPSVAALAPVPSFYVEITDAEYAVAASVDCCAASLRGPPFAG